MEFQFDYNKKKIKLDVKVCDNIFSQTLGLMFRKNSKALLFVFKKPVKISIHSFFCKPFIAIWFRGNKIIDKKLVDKNLFSVKPKEKFDKLLEIPNNEKSFRSFLDDKRNI